MEAKYFLQCLSEKQSDRDAFKYNLSAFLSAFRSITFIMQKEFANIPEFELWYISQQVILRLNDKMKLLNAKRVLTVHQVPVQLRAEIHINIGEQITLTDTLTMEIIHSDRAIEKEEPAIIEYPLPSFDETKENDQWFWYFDDYPNFDVLSICNECVIYLETIILECELKFSTN